MLWRGPAVRELRGDPLRQGRGSPPGGAASVARPRTSGRGTCRPGSADAVPDLERLVAEHPLRERRWSLLVLALYRQGRQGAALEAWARARDVLADELGVDPGPELRELQRRGAGAGPGARRADPRVAAGWARRRYAIARAGGRALPAPAGLGPGPRGRDAHRGAPRPSGVRTVPARRRAGSRGGPERVGAGARRRPRSSCAPTLAP